MDARPIELALAAGVLFALVSWVALLLVWYVGGFC
jgi:hypothetical protein